MNKKGTEEKNRQFERFIETARAIGCDDDDAAFKDRLKKLIAAPVKKGPVTPKAKKTSK